MDLGVKRGKVDDTPRLMGYICSGWYMYVCVWVGISLCIERGLRSYERGS